MATLWDFEAMGLGPQAQGAASERREQQPPEGGGRPQRQQRRQPGIGQQMQSFAIPQMQALMGGRRAARMDSKHPAAQQAAPSPATWNHAAAAGPGISTSQIAAGQFAGMPELLGTGQRPRPVGEMPRYGGGGGMPGFAGQDVAGQSLANLADYLQNGTRQYWVASAPGRLNFVNDTGGTRARLEAMQALLGLRRGDQRFASEQRGHDIRELLGLGDLGVRGGQLGVDQQRADIAGRTEDRLQAESEFQRSPEAVRRQLIGDILRSQPPPMIPQAIRQIDRYLPAAGGGDSIAGSGGVVAGDGAGADSEVTPQPVVPWADIQYPLERAAGFAYDAQGNRQGKRTSIPQFLHQLRTTTEPGWIPDNWDAIDAFMRSTWSDRGDLLSGESLYDVAKRQAIGGTMYPYQRQVFGRLFENMGLGGHARNEYEAMSAWRNLLRARQGLPPMAAPRGGGVVTNVRQTENPLFWGPPVWGQEDD